MFRTNCARELSRDSESSFPPATNGVTDAELEKGCDTVVEVAGARVVRGAVDVSLAELALWMQEHTSLCAAIASSGRAEPEGQSKLKDLLVFSADRGRKIVESISQRSGDVAQIMSKIQVAVTQSLVPVAGSALHKVTVPLSGVRRFDEGRTSVSLKGNVKQLPTSPSLPSHPIGVTPSYISSTSNVSISSQLVPSRTYIKK